MTQPKAKNSFLSAFGIIVLASFLGLSSFYLAVFYFYNYSWVGKDCLDSKEICQKNNDATVKTFLSLNSCKEFFENKKNDFVCSSGVDVANSHAATETFFREVYTSKDGQLTRRDVPLAFTFGEK